MLQAAKRGHTSEFYQADLDFHRCLWRATGNQTLMDLLEQIVPQLFAFVIMQHSVRERADLLVTAEEHGHLLGLIRSGDRDAARKLIETRVPIRM
jgi:DNA-binding GntR family transcriptional regulator